MLPARMSPLVVTTEYGPGAANATDDTTARMLQSLILLYCLFY